MYYRSSLQLPHPLTSIGRSAIYEHVALNTAKDWALFAQQLSAVNDGISDTRELPPLEASKAQSIAGLFRNSAPTQASIESLVSICSTLLPMLQKCDSETVKPVLDALVTGITAKAATWNLNSEAACHICMTCARMGPDAMALFKLFERRVGAAGIEVLLKAENAVLRGAYGPHFLGFYTRHANSVDHASPKQCGGMTRVLQYHPGLDRTAVGHYLVTISRKLVTDQRSRINRRDARQRTDQELKQDNNAQLARTAVHLRSYWDLPETHELLEALVVKLDYGFGGPPQVPDFDSQDAFDAWILDVVTMGNPSLFDLHCCPYDVASHLMRVRLQSSTEPFVAVTGNSDVMKQLVTESAKEAAPGWHIDVRRTTVHLSVTATGPSGKTTGAKRTADDGMDRDREQALRQRLLETLELRHQAAVPPGLAGAMPVVIPQAVPAAPQASEDHPPGSPEARPVDLRDVVLEDLAEGELPPN